MLSIFNVRSLSRGHSPRSLNCELLPPFLLVAIKGPCRSVTIQAMAVVGRLGVFFVVVLLHVVAPFRLSRTRIVEPAVLYNVSLSVNLHNGIAPEPLPMVVNGTLFTVDNSDNNNLTAMDVATGKIMWVAGPIYFGYTTRLVAAQEQLFAQIRGDYSYTLKKIDTETGEMWTIHSGYQGYCYPFVVDEVMYLSNFDDESDYYSYFAFNLTSAEVLWETPVTPVDEPHRYLPAPCAIGFANGTLFLQQQDSLEPNTTYFGLSVESHTVVWSHILAMPTITSAYMPESLGVHGGRLIVRWNYVSKFFGFAPNGNVWEAYYNCHGNWWCGHSYVADGVLLHLSNSSSNSVWEGIDVSSGLSIWQSATIGEPSFSTCNLWVFTSNEKYMHAIHPRTRKVAWNVSWPHIWGPFCCLPVSSDPTGSTMYLRYKDALFALSAHSGDLEWSVASSIDKDDYGMVLWTKSGVVLLTDENYIVGIKPKNSAFVDTQPKLK